MASSPPADTAAPIAAPDTTVVVIPVTAPISAPVAAPIIEADNDYDEADSSFGTDAGSSLNFGSVTSSIFQYREENGRTYHAYSDGKYLIPNDEKEQDRMDMVYHATTLIFEGKLFFAPVKNPQRILDMGTGTGIWALDVGDAYPEAHVIGIDLSPQQPKWTAPNVEFRVDDLEKPWVFETPLDLVHTRICAGVAVKSWPNYLAEAYKSLRPGGWVEAQEFSCRIESDDGSIEGTKIKAWGEFAQEGVKIIGGDVWPTAAGLKAHMQEAGFVNLGVVEFKWPLAPWPKDQRLKEAGHITMLSLLEDLIGLSLGIFTRILGWERIEVELFIADVKTDLMKRAIHAYYPLMVVYGQKPEDKNKEEEVEVDVGPAATTATGTATAAGTT